MDYANTTTVEFKVDLKVLFHGWLIYSYLQISKHVPAEKQHFDKGMRLIVNLSA